MKTNLFLKSLLSLLLAVIAYGSSMALNVSGTVWVDANNNNVVDAGETATDFGGTMYVNLVNTSGVVIASAPVNTNGTYTLTGVANNLVNHKLVLTNTPTNPNGNRVPGTYFSAEEVIGASNTASQTGSLLGEINLRTATTNIGNQNFQMSQQTAFGCLDGIAYQVAIAAGETASSLYSYNVSSGTRSLINASPFNVNALIYSSAAQNMLWGTIAGTNSLVRFGAGGGTVEFPVPNLPVLNYNVGVELPSGYMMVYTTNNSDYYVIDVDPSRATYLELVDPTNGFALKTGPNYGTPVSAPFAASDFAYLASTQLCYGITSTSAITTMNPLTGAVTTNPAPVTGLPAAAYGAIFSDQSGKLYAFNNTTGAFYKIDPVANTATFLSSSVPSGGNDGASCPTAVVECDTDIVSTPADTTLCVGASTTFTVSPEGNGPFTYQWQISTNGGNSWTNMQTTPFSGANGNYSGAGTKTLTVNPVTTLWNGYQFRTLVTSNLCVTPTNSSTLNVYAVPGAPVLVANTDAPICPATTYDLRRLVLGTPPAGSTLQFYTSSTPSPATLVADPSVAPAGTYYAIYANPGCNGPVSQPITITSCLTPFSCEDGIAYQVSAAAGELVSSLYAYNVITGTRTLVAPLSLTVNSLIYSATDNTLWATKNGEATLVHIDANGTLIQYPIANMSGSFNIGAELPGGYMLVYQSNQPTYYVIDINPARPTYLRLVDPANGYALQTGPTYGKSISTPANVADLVYVPTTNLVYGVESTTAKLVTLNPATGASSVGSVISGLPTGTSFGAVFADPTGKLYAFANDPGTFHRVNISANTSTMLSTSVPSNSNDGASCPNSILENLPFDCTDGITYQVAAAAGETVSSLYAYNINTGARTLISPLPILVNSLVYNSVDDMLWATKNTTNSIVRIDKEGGTVEYPITNLPGSPANYNVGVELPNGYMMIYQTGQSNYYVIDLNPNRSTYLQLVDPTNAFALKTGPNYGTPVSAPFGVADIAFVSSAQLCYGITQDGQLTTLDPFTGNVTVGAAVKGLPAASSFGAVFTDATGKLYAFHNNSGSFYKIDPTTNSSVFLSTSVPSNSNDGANCATATLCDIELTEPDPQTQTVCTGNTATFTVTASGTGTLTYQWQVSTDNGTNWTNLLAGGAANANGSYSGAGTAVLSLTPATTAWNGNQYRVIVGSGGGLCSPTSIAGNLIVNDFPDAPVLQSADTKPVCPAITADLTKLVTSTAPTGSVLQFYTTSTPGPSTLVSDPTQAPAGTYYAFYTNAGCSSPASTAITVEEECAPLPVTLVSFTARKETTGEQGVAILNWATTEETNSDRFDIERSSDAKTWKTIGKKTSGGESKVLKTYDFTDQNPVGGINYYRLRMVDKDATFAYSRIQSVEFGTKIELNAYPNPVSEALLFKNYEQIQQVILYNVSGLKTFQSNKVTERGIDISKLTPGIYTVSVTLADGTHQTSKVIVVAK